MQALNYGNPGMTAGPKRKGYVNLCANRLSGNGAGTGRQPAIRETVSYIQE
jgi:hypothetical protein